MRRIFKILFFIFLLFVITLIIDFIGDRKFKNDFESKLILREEVIKKIESKELEVYKNNRVILTEKYGDVAENDYVYVYVCNDKEKVISFLYKDGIPDEDQYIFYSSGNDDLIKKYVPKSYYSYIEKITDNWYMVQFN